jgi:tRNA-dihydrouridine synthase A
MSEHQTMAPSLALDRRLSVAPMMGCTDRHCRVLLRLLSPHALLYSEMIATGALLHGDTERILAHGIDEPAAFQLGGSDPEDLAACARLIEQAGYREVNLNCGCPSDRVQVGGIGACLMAEPDLVAGCYRAMAEAVNIPVTIKCRIGIDDRDDYGFFTGFLTPIHQAGCRVFIVHARKAILQGLSPRENREIPPLVYDYVRRAMADFPDTTFVLNGGIKTAEEVRCLQPGFHGLMLGRAPYANPWLLAEIEQQCFGTPMPDPELILAAYRDYMTEQIASGTAVKYMAKHLLGFFTGHRGARAFRRYLSSHMFAADAGIEVLDDALAESGVLDHCRAAMTVAR